VSLSTPGLPTSSGSNVTVEFWMDWNGSSASTMPFGFGGYDLWLANGNLGFNTLNSDLYGTSVSGLANRWVQVTAVFHNGDATQSKLYIDGVAQTLSQIYGTTTTGTVGSTAQISGFAGGSGFNFGGDMQDVAIYPTALSSTRITAHYDAGTAVGGYANNVMADSPSGYWRLGESSGTTATEVEAARSRPETLSRRCHVVIAAEPGHRTYPCRRRAIAPLSGCRREASER
jgi:hypothetical protein